MRMDFRALSVFQHHASISGSARGGNGDVSRTSLLHSEHSSDLDVYRHGAVDKCREVLVRSQGQRHALKCQVIYWEPWDVFGSTPVPLNSLFQSPSHYRRSALCQQLATSPL